jgi:hypothetical protein
MGVMDESFWTSYYDPWHLGFHLTQLALPFHHCKVLKRKFASVFGGSTAGCRNSCNHCPLQWGPSAPTKGFTFRLSLPLIWRVHLCKALHTRRRRDHYMEWQNLGCWHLLIKGSSFICQVKSLERGAFLKRADALDNKPWFLETPLLCGYPTFLCLIFGWIFFPITSERGGELWSPTIVHVIHLQMNYIWPHFLLSIIHTLTTLKIDTCLSNI